MKIHEIIDTNLNFERIEFNSLYEAQTHYLSKNKQNWDKLGNCAWRESAASPQRKHMLGESEPDLISGLHALISGFGIGHGAPVRVGQKLSILKFEILAYQQELEVNGFLDPLTIVKIVKNENKIKFMVFDNGMRWPPQQLLNTATVNYTDHDVFFHSRDEAESAIAAVAIMVPEHWTFNVAGSLNEDSHRSAMSEDKEFDIRALLRNVLPFVMDEIGLSELPKLKLLDKPKGTTFGKYDPSTKKIELVIGGRHPLDIIRSLVHELIHHRQDLDGLVNDESGNDGSAIENEANAQAGEIMRTVNRKFKEYLNINF